MIGMQKTFCWVFPELDLEQPDLASYMIIFLTSMSKFTLLVAQTGKVIKRGSLVLCKYVPLCSYT